MACGNVAGVGSQTLAETVQAVRGQTCVSQVRKPALPADPQMWVSAVQSLQGFRTTTTSGQLPVDHASVSSCGAHPEGDGAPGVRGCCTPASSPDDERTRSRSPIAACRIAILFSRQHCG